MGSATWRDSPNTLKRSLPLRPNRESTESDAAGAATTLDQNDGTAGDWAATAEETVPARTHPDPKMKSARREPHVRFTRASKLTASLATRLAASRSRSRRRLTALRTDSCRRALSKEPPLPRGGTCDHKPSTADSRPQPHSAGLDLPRLTVESIDVDRCAHRHHTIQRFNVFVPKSNAPMADRTANRLGLVRPVQRVAVTEVQSMCSQHASELPLVRSKRRNDDVAIGNDLPSLSRSEERRVG